MKRLFTLVFFIGLMATLVYTGYYLYQKSEEQPVTYDTESPKMGDVIKKTVATGSIIPREEVGVKPRVSGLLAELYLEPGMEVRRGQKIARVQIIPNAVELNQAEARVAQNQIALDNAERTFQRYEKLYEQGAISDEEYQTYQNNYDQARQQLTAARDNLELVRSGASSRSGEDFNVVVSPVAGTILDIPVEEGYSVIEPNNFNEGTTIATVANLQDMIFEGFVDESEVGKVREGMPCRITVGALNETQFEGRLEYIAPKGVEEEGAVQFKIRARVQPRDSLFLRAGYSANADIILERRDSVMVINESLVQYDDLQKPFVEVKTGPQEFERREVKLGLSDGIRREVLEGLELEDELKIAQAYGRKQAGR